MGRYAVQRAAARRAARDQERRELVAAAWRRAHPCSETPEIVREGETYLAFMPKWREWRIPYRPGFGGGDQQIRYCPFCGNQLPESLFGPWFERLADMGLAEPMSGARPAEFESSAWWEGPSTAD